MIVAERKMAGDLEGGGVSHAIHVLTRERWRTRTNDLDEELRVLADLSVPLAAANWAEKERRAQHLAEVATNTHLADVAVPKNTWHSDQTSGHFGRLPNRPTILLASAQASTADVVDLTQCEHDAPWSEAAAEERPFSIHNFEAYVRRRGDIEQLVTDFNGTAERLAYDHGDTEDEVRYVDEIACGPLCVHDPPYT